VYETSSDEDTTSSGSGGAQTLSELVDFHIDIKFYMEGLTTSSTTMLTRGWISCVQMFGRKLTKSPPLGTEMEAKGGS
jgi:hypothetical protein